MSNEKRSSAEPATDADIWLCMTRDGVITARSSTPVKGLDWAHYRRVSPADAASDPLRAAVQAAVDLMEAREWAEHFAECHAPGDELASRLEACITTLHNEAYGGEDRADPASEADKRDAERRR